MRWCPEKARGQSTWFFFKSAFFEKVVLQTYKSHPSVEKNYGFLRYGTCWTHALKDLETGCKNLDDEVQSRQVILYCW